MTEKRIAVPQPWHPVLYRDADVAALKALAAGTATDVQQKRALDWIINSAGTYDLSFRADSERVTSFAEGKRFVGLQIVKMINLPVQLLKRKENR